jgi:hypothetical protein
MEILKLDYHFCEGVVDVKVYLNEKYIGKVVKYYHSSMNKNIYICYDKKGNNAGFSDMPYFAVKNILGNDREKLKLCLN